MAKDSTQPPESQDQAAEASKERVSRGTRVALALLFLLVLVGDVTIYSSYQALRSTVEHQDHEIERLEEMVTNMLAANENAKKVEGIETQVESIDGQLTDLKKVLEDEAEAEEKALAEKKKKGAKRRRR